MQLGPHPCTDCFGNQRDGHKADHHAMAIDHLHDDDRGGDGRLRYGRYPMGGTIDGQYGDHILLAPPFILEDHHLDEIADKLLSAVNITLKGL